MDKLELGFFLKGNTSLDAVERKNPFKWLAQSGWKDLQMLSTLGEVWKTIVDDVEQGATKWKHWYDLETPE